MLRLSLTLTALMTVGSLAAQTQDIRWFKDNSPTVGRGNAFPFGSNGVRYQAIIPGSTFQNKPVLINDIFVAGRGGNRQVFYPDVEIRMGLTAQVNPTNNWATNNPAPNYKYRGPLYIDFVTGQWTGIGLPKPYLYLPLAARPNLCFEVIVWKTDQLGLNFYFPLTGSGTNAIPRAFRYQWTTNQTQGPLTGSSAGMKMGFLIANGNFIVAGKACQGSSNNTPAISGKDLISGKGWPIAGRPFTVSMSNGKPSSPAILMIGLSIGKFGALTLPFDLAPLGAAGCFVRNDPLLLLFAATNTSGLASLNLPIPSLTGNARLYMHWWNLDGQANAFGWTTSNLGQMILGN